MIEKALQEKVSAFVKSNFEADVPPNEIVIQPTRKEFVGDVTVVLFPLLKVARMNPVQLGTQLGEFLESEVEDVVASEVVKGFLNLSYSDEFWKDAIVSAGLDADFGQWPSTDEKIVVEFSSPNTNKPLHLGHIRNILLGSSIANILEVRGHDVIRTQVVNDRGIAICKSMVVQKEMAGDATPQSKGQKGDHYVGDLYVQFEVEFQKEYAEWQSTDKGEQIYSEEGREGEERDSFFSRWKNEYFNQYSSWGQKAKELLLQWEAGDEKVMELWTRMNGWVYEGFKTTYDKLAVDFDANYYESETYKLGNEYVNEGLDRGLFFKKEDGSIWVDLTERKLDEKILRRGDGTSLYITQDIGTAQKRYEDFEQDRMIYVVGNEQEYHFQVLFEILDLLDAPYADGCFHLSYGMVDLPDGKMKSREGKVVDADDLMEEVIDQAEENSEERGDLVELDSEARNEIYRRVGLAALKFFIIKVHPQKRMVFDPAASLDVQGQTGPYIQNAYVRIQSIFRKLGCPDQAQLPAVYEWQVQERALAAAVYQYPAVIAEAADRYDPSHVANYAYDLAKLFHKFYHDISIQREPKAEVRQLRLMLCQAVAAVLEKSMSLLGIEMPERM
jgi:arginyl-tRNA synthetase